MAGAPGFGGEADVAFFLSELLASLQSAPVETNTRQPAASENSIESNRTQYQQVYGSIIGMFEQNNLALNIPSPAEVYFGLARDESAIPDAAERAALEAQVCLCHKCVRRWGVGSSLYFGPAHDESATPDAAERAAQEAQVTTCTYV